MSSFSSTCKSFTPFFFSLFLRGGGHITPVRCSSTRACRRRYQRYIYRVDKTRANEYGLVPEDRYARFVGTCRPASVQADISPRFAPLANTARRTRRRRVERGAKKPPQTPRISRRTVVSSTPNRPLPAPRAVSRSAMCERPQSSFAAAATANLLPTARRPQLRTWMSVSRETAGRASKPSHCIGVA